MLGMSERSCFNVVKSYLCAAERFGEVSLYLSHFLVSWMADGQNVDM